MLYVLGIGTNLGNKIANIKTAIEHISGKLNIIKISNIHKLHLIPGIIYLTIIRMS
jgi:7,8-dihydro-6-hydroxymethylpterin-pyrophosphokinase